MIGDLQPSSQNTPSQIQYNDHNHNVIIINQVRMNPFSNHNQSYFIYIYIYKDFKATLQSTSTGVLT